MVEFEPGTVRVFELTPALVIAARALLGWTQKELATRAGVGVSTVADYERGARQAHRLILRRLAHVFEVHGIRFVCGPRETGVLKS